MSAEVPVSACCKKSKRNRSHAPSVAVIRSKIEIPDRCLPAAGERRHTAKEAWINPKGGHLGRQPRIWPDPVIFNKVLVPWIIRQANGSTAP
jgi:esterase FrsA